MSSESAATTSKEIRHNLTLDWKENLASPRVDATGSLVLNPELASEIADHLAWEKRLPGLCVVAVEEAQQEAVDNATSSWHWPFWLIPIAGVAGFAFGFSLGHGRK